MRISLHIDAESLEDYQSAVRALLGGGVPVQDKPPVHAPVVQAAGATSVNDDAKPTVEVAAAPAAGAASAEEEPKRRGRGRPPKDQPQISTGEPREEVQEINGAAVQQPAPAPSLSLEDIRNALGVYVNAYGMQAVQVDGPALLSRLFGEGKVKISDIPTDQGSLSRALAAIETATAKNEFKRALVTP